jgi:hypothetical protein
MLFRDEMVFVSTTWRILRLRVTETAYNMEGSCEYFEREVADIHKGVVLQHEGLWEKIAAAPRKNFTAEEINWTATQPYRFFGTT